jgi:hypothetical protein
MTTYRNGSVVYSLNGKQIVKKTAWSHLPNAKYIDWVISSVKEHPEKWDAARDQARYALIGATWNTGRDEAMFTAWYASKTSAWGAIAALVAYDDCAYMIKLEVSELKLIVESGDLRAILLLPARIVFNETRD